MKSLLERVKTKLNAQGGFLKAVAVLVGGTIFAQIITIITLPIITRLYNPEDFGVLSVYISILTIISTIACLRFDIAIPLPQKKQVAVNLVVLSFISVLIFTIISIIIVLIFSNKLLSINENYKYLIYILPLGVFFSGSSLFLQFWTSRTRKFKLISQTRVAQALGSSLVQISMSFMILGPIGLLLGQLMINIIGFGKLLKNFLSETIDDIKKVNSKDLKETFKQYEKFPKYSTSEALLNVGSIQLPILIIGIYESKEAGLLLLAMRIMAIPMSLIGASIGQVFLSYASNYYNKGELEKFTVSTIKKLGKIGFLPFMLIAFTSPFLIKYIFGPEWADVGWMISLMVPWFFMQFITSPVSMSLHVNGKQKIALYLQLFGLILRVGIVLVSIEYFTENVINLYIISGAVFYLIYFIVVLKNLKKGNYEAK